MGGGAIAPSVFKLTQNKLHITIINYIASI